MLGVAALDARVHANDTETTFPIVVGFERTITNRSEFGAGGGQLLLGELSCTACHKPPAAWADRLAPKSGPRLDGVASRLSVQWLHRFLGDPQAIKPGTTMPDMFASLNTAQRDAQITPLVHFLATLTDELPVGKKRSSKADSIRGKTLYHQVGCVACHAPDPAHGIAEPKTGRESSRSAVTNKDPQPLDNDDDDDGLVRTRTNEHSKQLELPSIPLGRLQAKYTHEQLASFLSNPLQVRPAGRMPDLKLKPQEALDIAGYLLGKQQAVQFKPFQVQAELAAKGRKLFSRLGCVQCHSISGIEASAHSMPLANLRLAAQSSCLSNQTANMPNYSLRNAQDTALRGALREVALEPNYSTSPAKRVGHTMTALNCFSCHSRSNVDEHSTRGGVDTARRSFFETVDHIDLGDEGRIPPDLTGVGRKLTRDWMRKVLEGQGEVRPYLRVRMPRFGESNVGHLADDFFVTDRHPTPEDRQDLTQGNAAAGRRIMGTGCVQCHAIKGKRMPGVIGIDLASAQARLQPTWFRDFLLAPASQKRGTRMPTFWPKGKTTLPNILQGSTQQQLAALWSYLGALDTYPLPIRLEQKGTFELVPKDRPILLRTFLKGAGTHAIAVGFPQKIHVAFDAQTIRPAIAWRGRFLDAHGTWFDRFAPPAEPLGSDQMRFPQGMPLARLADSRAAWPEQTGRSAGYRLRGYRLDSQGVPTFMSEFEKIQIEDRFIPAAAGANLIRHVMLTGQAGDIWFRALVGKQIDRIEDKVYVCDNVVRIRWHMTTPPQAKLRTVDGRQELIVPIRFNEDQARLEIEYQW